MTDINKIIIDTSLKSNNPSLLLALQEIQSTETDELFSRIIQQYIATKDNRWLESVFLLSEKIDKKSSQSRVFASIARDLIDAGVSGAAPNLIDQGMIILDRISFRKYRSEIMIDIIPLLIVWAITTRNQKLLNTSLFLIEEIGDISKRAVLHAELAKALATVAILEKNRTLFFDSIQSATNIHQKMRRQDCISEIIGKGAKSVFGKEMADIPQFLSNFNKSSHDAYLEIISALTEQLLERVRDKTQIITILEQLCQDQPDVTGTIVIDLLKKAERSGDLWFLSTAMDLQQHITDGDEFPVREMVRAGISVASTSNDMQVLIDLIPVLNKHCNPVVMSRIYLQFSQIMLSSGNFSFALSIFGKINQESESQSSYSDCLIQLLKEGILNDSIPLIHHNILLKLNADVVNNAIYRAIIDVCKDCSSKDLVSHILSIRNLILLHPKQDHLILESITILVDRGFLDSNDPSILIKFAESIREQALKERAISNIVIKIAKIGVRTKNRDFLQRAVGLTCEIDGQNTRSAALSSIIDEASILAAQQGDLDLLLRMKVWSNSLLEKDLVSYAMANIIDGVIKYAIDKQSCDALEEAYLIAEEINDPSLKTQLFERIAECFVKIGCILLKNQHTPSDSKDYSTRFLPFERGLGIIKNNVKSPQISLKIAGIIDIIISYSRTSNNLDYIVPLAMFAVEIENSYERDAMMSRIISNLNDEISHPNSTDPYETMAFLLKRNDLANSTPRTIGLIHRILQMVNDPYTRLTGLCDLADLLIWLRKSDYASQVLEDVVDHLDILTSGYQKVLVHTYLASSYSQIDLTIAEKYLMQAINQIDTIEFDKDATTRRQIVHAIVRLNTINPDTKWYTIAVQIVQKITEPVEYVNSLISVHNMVRQEKVRCRELIKFMEDAAEKITSPYEKASVLLNIIPLTMQNADNELPFNLLKKTETLTKKINIQSIADTIRNNIAEIYTVVYQKNHDKKMLAHAIQITKSIDDDETRFYRLEQLGYTEMYEITPQFVKIKSLSERMVSEGIHPNHVAALERLVRTVADRGKEAVFFCYLSIYFKKKGQEKLSRKMLQNSIKEARIIRPLTRRSFVMCDIALKIFAAGCEQTAQEILDLAIDAATNIRQSSSRDEVFDELGLAIKIMQRM
ncbi:MAG: hypothetical protein M0R30_06635 [Methanoregula sp.]|uniref:hypothetical protein n=1 Tax=Methanoregula sp. TaxID=2052170 RepID=UPI0025CF1702|nr:hypothetical protein [Methanoregula sp.]MCK9631303.1 hypothetical protein [Methanoregula sp.]